MDNFKVAHNCKRRLPNAPNPQNSEAINTRILYTSRLYLYVFYLCVTCCLNTKHTQLKRPEPSNRAHIGEV